MLTVYPDYYSCFHCIADACRHSCCIGWEIDIDEDTLQYYERIEGEMGARLREKIERSPTPHFILDEKEHCPFLRRGLCDLITELGEDSLCTICAEHPRFHCELPGRIESGLGLCCEEAARLILTNEAPMRLIYKGIDEANDEILLLRDEILTVLQDRTQPVDNRVHRMLDLCGAPYEMPSPSFWRAFLQNLEQLDPEWSSLLTHLDDSLTPASLPAVEEEQLLVYLIYRHFASAPDLAETSARARFAAVSLHLLRLLAAFPGQDFINLCRLFSSEIEYSQENLDAFWDILQHNREEI